ncbi:MAG: tetratricopeptide repeat protein, partial [Chitinispirillia bacterium]
HREQNRPIAKKMITILETEYGSSDYYKRAKAEMLLWDADTLKALSLLESLPKKSDEDIYVLSQVYISTKNVEKAEFYCNNIPNNDEWQKQRSILFASLSFIKGDYQSSYSQFSALNDTSFIFNYNKALSAYKAGKYYEAIKIINPFLIHVTGKDKADAYRLTGNSAFALKQWENARLSYLQLSVIELQNPVVQYNLAVASYNLDNMKDAWKYYKNARALDSTLINKDIENKYHAMLAEEQDSMTTQDTLAMTYNQAVDHQKYGRDSIAEVLYYSILDLDSGHFQSLNNLGTIYAARADYNRSEKFYKKAIQKKKNMSEAYANLIKVYIATNQLPKAKSLLDKAKLLIPFDILLIQVENELNDSLAKMELK